MELCPFEGFQILPFLKIFLTDFSKPKKARKLKVPINMHNDWMYRVYQNKGVMSLGRFSKNYNAFCVIIFMFVVLFM